MSGPWLIEGASSPVIATAIHAGHDLRPEIEAAMAIDADDRCREEDLYSEELTGVASTRVVVSRSRFEVDLNRPREEAIYADPADSWGLELWKAPLPPEVVERSLAIHDAFYADMAVLLDRCAAEHGRFVVLDFHSYNHRRGGPGAPFDPPEENPEVNVGTRSLDRTEWGSLVDRFMKEVEAASGLDIRENVRFKGRHMASWIHDRYPETGCCLAIEIKKSFMDEWTGELYPAELSRRKVALAAAVPGLLEELEMRR